MSSTIYWSGRSTNGIWKRKAEAESFIKLFEKLENNDVINNCDEDVYDNAILEKLGKTVDDKCFQDEDGELDYDKVTKFIEDSSVSLSDKELMDLISDQKGNAFYQKFEIECINEDGDEALREIEEEDFDKNGKFIG